MFFIFPMEGKLNKKVNGDENHFVITTLSRHWVPVYNVSG